MATLLEKVEQDALSLPPKQRAFLADRLLSSLGGEVLSDVDVVWIMEAERRYREYKEGKRTPISATDVFAEADRLLK
ncbi:MAG: addiction module protein [bacterium]|nr:addiction module protein [bacterium]